MPLKFLHDHREHPIRLGKADIRQQLVARVGMRTTCYGVLDNTSSCTLKIRERQTPMQAAQLYGWVVYGQRLNLFPHWHPISLPGDSGSWILNSEGDLIALHYAGDGASYAFVTPIEEVILDIEERTNRTIRLPGGVSRTAYGDPSLPAAYAGP